MILCLYQPDGFRFILNGLENANSILNDKVFHIDDWNVIGEFAHDEQGGRHQAFYAPKMDVVCCGVKIKAGERVQIEQSLKYSEQESHELWSRAGLKEVEKWTASADPYSKITVSLCLAILPVFKFVKMALNTSIYLKILRYWITAVVSFLKAS
jgi:hypothetical protein